MEERGRVFKNICFEVVLEVFDILISSVVIGIDG